MLRAGRSRARFPIRLFNFFSLPNPFRHNLALGLFESLTDINIKNLPGVKEQPARRAAICEPIFLKMWCPQNLTPL
jgi:hypothetical protein